MTAELNPLLPGQNPGARFDRLVRILLMAVVVALLAAEWFFPPIRAAIWSSDWGGRYVARHARRSFEPQATGFKIDPKVLTLELLVIAALTLAALPTRRDREVAGTARLARAAVASHAGTVLLPIAVAGGDTVWIGANPMVAIFFVVHLIPQGILLTACIDLGWNKAPLLGEKFAAARWCQILAVFAALCWTFWCVTAVPLFVISPFGAGSVSGQPLSGAWSTAIAMWLSVAAMAAARRETDTLNVAR